MKEEQPPYMETNLDETNRKDNQAAEELSDIAQRWKDKRGSLIMALHDLQGRCGYVPRAEAMSLARQMSVPLARIYEVITFYNFFKLKAPGQHIISICMGTACYLKGAPQLLEHVSRQLDVKPGQTSADGQYHLQMVRCVGCCGLAPVVLADGETLAKADWERVRTHLCTCEHNNGKQEQQCLA